MRILITGGAGFVGRHLAEFLLSKNHMITILDQFSNSTKNEILYLLKKGVTLIEGDITESKSLEQIKEFDSVVHLAAQINVDASILDPDYTMKVNVVGTENLLKICIKNKIKNFVFASSAAVYGEPKSLPLSEYSATDSISPYGKSKILMENLVKDYSKFFNINCISLRFFNIYGIGQSEEYAGVISKFLKNIDDSQNLTIFGNGTQTRDFISVDDITMAIEHAIINLNGKTGDCYNIGSGDNISIKELAELMIKISGKNIGIEYGPKKVGDIQHSSTSINLAKNQINFSPKISLKDGLKKLLKSSS
jgi:UDP-glucose 4-epimerase